MRDLELEPEPYAGFTPVVVTLLGNQELQYPAMTALAHLPFEPIVAEAAARALGPSPSEVTYWSRDSLALLARSSDPRYVPWLALADSWMNWPHTFNGLANIGEPIGIAIIEAWTADNAAADRSAVADSILAALRAKGGEPTEAPRAEAAAYFVKPEKKKKMR